MSFRITGREALSTFDRAVGRLRDKVAKAIDAADDLDHREGEIRQEQIDRFLKLADIRMDEIAERDPADLDRMHRDAKRLLDEHDAYVEAEAKRLAAASDAIAKLEREREGQGERRAALLESYETLVAETEAKLKTDADYLTLLNASDEAAAVAERAEHKLLLAREELESKGAPYRDDPLFSYLWERGFRTQDYKAMSVFRWLDGWVAHLCKYDKARANFARLNGLPVWLEEHAETQTEEAEQALRALEAKEASALEDSGAETVRLEADAAFDSMQAIDTQIEDGEAQHGILADAHAEALAGKAGPAQEARRLLNQGLQRLDVPTLRRLAAETYTPVDDDLVSDLVELKREELGLEIEAEDVKALPQHLKRDLSALETLRRQFKQGQLDSAYALFQPAAIDQAITTVLDGATSPDKAYRRLKRNVKRREPRTNSGFGGPRRSTSLGIPEVLGEVAWEVFRHSDLGRSVGLPKRGSGGRRSRRTSFPKPRRRGSGGKRGGWRTGGGF
ncbi:MAG: hypothetical protein AAFP81_05040 [Pseudomonadota bacterium]